MAGAPRSPQARLDTCPCRCATRVDCTRSVAGNRSSAIRRRRREALSGIQARTRSAANGFSNMRRDASDPLYSAWALWPRPADRLRQSRQPAPRPASGREREVACASLWELRAFVSLASYSRKARCWPSLAPLAAVFQAALARRSSPSSARRITPFFSTCPRTGVSSVLPPPWLS